MAEGDTKSRQGGAQGSPDRGQSRRRRERQKARGTTAGATGGFKQPRSRKARPQTSTSARRKTRGGARPTPAVGSPEPDAQSPIETPTADNQAATAPTDQPAAAQTTESPSGDTPPPPRAEDRISDDPPPPKAEDRISDDPPPPRAEDRIENQSAPPEIQRGSGVYDDKDGKNPGAKKAAEQAEKAGGVAAKKEAQASKKDGQKSSLSDKEKSKIDNKIDKSLDKFDERRKKNKQKQRRGPLRSTRSKIALGFAGIGAAASIVSAIAFLPTWALNQMHSKVQDAFMDRVNYAMTETANKIIERYLRDQILPSLSTCPNGRITNQCYVDPGNGPLSNLYSRWRKARVDQKLQSRFGITVQNTNGEIEIFRNGVSQGTYGRRTAGSRLVSRGILDVTEGFGVRDRWLLRHTINSDYGGKWCMFLCQERDGLDDRFSPLQRLKLKVATRIAVKNDARVGAFFICSIINCNREDLERQSRAGAKQAVASVDQEILREAGEALRTQNLSEALTRDFLSRIGKEQIVEDMLFRIGIRTGIRGATRAIPVVGWVLFAVHVALAFDYIDEGIRTRQVSDFLYKRNLAAYIEFASNMTVCRDEGQSLLPLQGFSGTASLSERAACFQYIMGFGGSRVWQASNGISPKSTVSCTTPTRLSIETEDGGFGLDDLFTGAFEVVRIPDESQERTVLRGENDPLVCPDKFTRRALALEDLRQSRYVSFFLDYLNPLKRCLPTSVIPVFGGAVEDVTGINCEGEHRWRAANVLRRIMGSIDDVASAAVGGLISFLGNVPGFGNLIGWAEDTTSEISQSVSRSIAAAFGSFVETVFPLPVNIFPNSGSEVLDQFAGGWNAMSEVYAQGVVDEDDEESIVGLQGRALEPVEVVELDRKIAEYQRLETADKSIAQRYFDLSDHRSLASTTLLNIASTLPLSGKPLGFNIDPTAMLSNAGSLFGFGIKASAQEATTGLPVNRSTLFGITQYGFSQADIDTLADSIDEESMSQLTPEACAEKKALRDDTELVEAPIYQPLQEGGFVEHITLVQPVANDCGLFKNAEMMLGKFADPDPNSALDSYLATTLEGLPTDPNQPGGGGLPGGGPVGDLGDRGQPTNNIPCYPVGLTGTSSATLLNDNEINLCTYGGLRNVNSSWSRTISAVHQLNPSLTGSGYRDSATQIRLRRNHCGPTYYDIYQRPSSQCSPPTARPGSSNHEYGLAIDFGPVPRCNTRSTACFNWLAQNRARIWALSGSQQFRNLASEPWHWSWNGR